MKLEWSEIKKIINGSASKEEVERFNSWLHQSPEHKEYFEKMEYYYYNTELAEEQNRSAKKYTAKQIYDSKRKSLSLRLIAVGASAVACVAFILIAVRQPEALNVEMKTPEKLVSKVEMTKINDEAIKLTTDSGVSYSIDEITQKEHSIESEMNVTSEKLIYKRSEAKKIEYHTITVPHGKTFVVELADGTTAHLNACSSLKYPTSFKEGDSREVYLNGEGFFNVTKSEKQRFIVKVNDLDIIVYGTRFNVNCYEENVETVLVDGSVAVKVNGKETKIVPNQKIEVIRETNETIVSDVNVDKYLSWQRNYFMFENEKLENIVKVLRRWYNIEIEIENRALDDVLINCNTPRYSSMNDFLDVLKNTGRIDYRIEGNKYIIK